MIIMKIEKNKFHATFTDWEQGFACGIIRPASRSEQQLLGSHTSTPGVERV